MKSTISHTIAALVGAVIVAATMQPKSEPECTRPHCNMWEYRLEVDGTDSTLLYTIRTAEGQVVEECITSGGLDSVIINDNL